LGEDERLVDMFVPIVRGTLMHGLSHVVRESVGSDREGIPYRVQQRRLDSLPELTGIKISGIKIDVENHEYLVLQGARKLIRKNRPLVLCELWENENRRSCFEFFKRENYDILVRIGRRLRPFDPRFHKRLNFFFVPRPSTDSSPPTR
jgi:hypothetical protein